MPEHAVARPVGERGNLTLRPTPDPLKEQVVVEFATMADKASQKDHAGPHI